MKIIFLTIFSALFMQSCSTTPTPALPDQVEYNIKPGGSEQKKLIQKFLDQGYKLKDSDEKLGIFTFEPHEYPIDRGSALKPGQAKATLQLVFTTDTVKMLLTHMCLYSTPGKEEMSELPCRDNDSNFQAARKIESDRVRSAIRRVLIGVKENVESGAPTPVPSEAPGRLEPNVKTP